MESNSAGFDISKRDCFVFAYQLDGQGGAKSIELVTPEQSNIWMHLDYSGSECQQTLMQMGLNHDVIDSLTRSDTRPRTLKTAEGLMINIRAVNMNPGSSPEDMVSLRCWIEQNRLITIRQRKVLSAQDLSVRLQDSVGPTDLSSLLISLFERIADRISTYVDSLEERLDEHEDNVETSDAHNSRSQVAMIRREAASVRRYLAPQRDALEAFSRQGENLINPELKHSMHEQSDRMMRYVEDLDLLKERAMVLQEELLNRIAQEQNARMYVLSIVAAIFLPISFVTGLFGMNVAGLPGLEEPAAFNWVAGSMIAVVIGIIVIFKKKNWL